VNIPFYLITHHAHSHGLKVLLTGEGADELFFGYRLYQQHALAEKMVPKALIQTIPGLLPLMQKLPISFGKKEALSSLIKSESSFVSGAKAWFDLQLNFSNNNKIWQSDPVLKQIVPNIDTTTNPYAEIFLQSQQQLSKIKNLSYSSKVFFLESQHRLPELLLMRADKISMLSSVENRVPFLDHALVEFVCSLPDAMKIPMLQTKFLLKQVAKKYLPERLIYRHKVGFSAPLEKVTPIVSKANQLFPFLKPKNHLQQWTLRVLQKFIEKQS
jgi:asparagine synthase (glutamine-hydrolysing)